MGLLTTKVPNREHTTQNSLSYTENTTIPNIDPIEEGSLYILVPLSALSAIMLLSLLVYLMSSNKKRLVHMYFKKRYGRPNSYNDNEYDSPLAQETDASREDEDDNEDNPSKSLLRGKLQINNHYVNYLSTSQLNRTSELFT